MLFSNLIGYFAVACNVRYFFGIPSWDKYLIASGKIKDIGSGICEANFSLTTGNKLDFSVILLVGLGVIEILLRIAGIVAVAFIIYGGIQYVTSQGEPDRSRKAQETIVNALIGLLIALVSVALVAFIGNRVG
jgi:hypothetical protein